VLTWADDQQSRQASVGQEIDVRLDAGDWCSTTSTPASEDRSIIALEQARAIEGSAWARFRAVGSGSTNITAVNKPSCRSHPASVQPARGFIVTVVVQ
jgi:hypothetical protein